MSLQSLMQLQELLNKQKQGQTPAPVSTMDSFLGQQQQQQANSIQDDKQFVERLKLLGDMNNQNANRQHDMEKTITQEMMKEKAGLSAKADELESKGIKFIDPYPMTAGDRSNIVSKYSKAQTVHDILKDIEEKYLEHYSTAETPNKAAEYFSRAFGSPVVSGKSFQEQITRDKTLKLAIETALGGIDLNQNKHATELIDYILSPAKGESKENYKQNLQMLRSKFQKSMDSLYDQAKRPVSQVSPNVEQLYKDGKMPFDAITNRMLKEYYNPATTMQSPPNDSNKGDGNSNTNTGLGSGNNVTGNQAQENIFRQLAKLAKGKVKEVGGAVDDGVTKMLSFTNPDPELSEKMFQKMKKETDTDSLTHKALMSVGDFGMAYGKGLYGADLAEGAVALATGDTVDDESIAELLGNFIGSWQSVAGNKIAATSKLTKGLGGIGGKAARFAEHGAKGAAVGTLYGARHGNQGEGAVIGGALGAGGHVVGSGLEKLRKYTGGLAKKASTPQAQRIKEALGDTPVDVGTLSGDKKLQNVYDIAASTPFAGGKGNMEAAIEKAANTSKEFKNAINTKGLTENDEIHPVVTKAVKDLHDKLKAPFTRKYNELFEKADKAGLKANMPAKMFQDLGLDGMLQSQYSMKHLHEIRSDIGRNIKLMKSRRASQGASVQENKDISAMAKLKKSIDDTIAGFGDIATEYKTLTKEFKDTIAPFRADTSVRKVAEGINEDPKITNKLIGSGQSKHPEAMRKIVDMMSEEEKAALFMNKTFGDNFKSKSTSDILKAVEGLSNQQINKTLSKKNKTLLQKLKDVEHVAKVYRPMVSPPHTGKQAINPLQWLSLLSGPKYWAQVPAAKLTRKTLENPQSVDNIVKAFSKFNPSKSPYAATKAGTNTNQR